MAMPDSVMPDQDREADSLLLSVEPLPAARDREAATGPMTDNDGNDR
jgi:hypothetical protein